MEVCLECLSCSMHSGLVLALPLADRAWMFGTQRRNQSSNKTDSDWDTASSFSGWVGSWARDRVSTTSGVQHIPIRRPALFAHPQAWSNVTALSPLIPSEERGSS
jgi:hypothetical protein